jgi:zinc transport system ATP-binding protein
MAIQVHNLSFQYDDNPLLENISFEISKGECVAIFGPNGGGKTTLLKLLMGFLKPSRGSLLINGMPPQKSRRLMGYVPQISHLDRQFPITALDVVKMGALSPSLLHSYSGDSQSEALQMLDKVGLKEMAKEPFGSLSGGQSQRVLIARALMGRPEYLFLDEATASVDPSAEKDFHTLINELKGTITIVMVTHDLPMEMSYIDRFFCVYTSITLFSPSQVCDHFAKGLYHPPLRKKAPHA